jgi:hypothetical protein
MGHQIYMLHMPPKISETWKTNKGSVLGEILLKPYTMRVLKFITTQQTNCNEGVEHDMAHGGVENFQHG